MRRREQDAQASSATAPEPFGLAWGRWTEEVRLAMAWNGGVSLAVWMGGVAVEIDAARTAREKLVDWKAEPPRTASAARDTGALYKAICYAFDRRLVVDILTGASAGGLNGALLAGAMAHDKRLKTKFMRDKWLTIGDFGLLLQPLDKQDVTSIMRGEKFLSALQDAFKELLGTDGPPSWEEDEPPVALDVQTTNVAGEQHCFVDDWGEPFFASEFRAPIRFRKPGDYTADVLAVAARASASFPAAFEPQELLGHVATLAGLSEKQRFAIDGGLLENAPIRPAIELIPRQRASAPVKRYVCYVNAAPTEQESSTPGAEQPDLLKVISYTVNLPRDGRVIDQLTALDESSRRAGTTADTGPKLIALASDAVVETAKALLPTYQQRRAVLALQEVLARGDAPSGPGAARVILTRLAKDAGAAAPSDLAAGAQRLPFIPVDFDPPQPRQPWRWGVRTAQRIIQLQLDMLRAVLLATETDADADLVFTGRAELDDALNELDALHDDFVQDANVFSAVQRLASDREERRTSALQRLRNYSCDYSQATVACLERASSSFARIYSQVTPQAIERAGLPAPQALFVPTPASAPTQLRPNGGSPARAPLLRRATQLAGTLLQLTPRTSTTATLPLAGNGAADAPGPLETPFFRRALAVEVVRRSFADDVDIESASSIRIAQLTPLIRSPLFDCGRPKLGGAAPAPAANGVPQKRRPEERDPRLGPQTSRDKLAGLRLNHFAGFYRGSWRANDFMWGRLDGAAAIARVLVDANRARVIAAKWNDPELEPARQLARALTPSGSEPGDDDRTELIWELIRPDETQSAPKDPASLRTQLEAKLREDLEDDTRDGELTWAICTRALQYEVLREEAPVLVQEVAADKTAGAFYANLAWPPRDSLKEPIDDLRQAREKQALPYLLGCDRPDEGTSTLALRTLSRTFLVAFAAIGGAVPLSRSLAPVRMPLLAVQGSTAGRILDRVAVVVAFTGAAWYLAARWTTVPAIPPKDIPLRAVWSPQTLALWVSILGVLGVAIVPALRAVRTAFPKRRIWDAAVAVALLVSAGAIGLVLQWIAHGTIEALTTWNASYRPPEQLLWVVVAAGGFHVASTLDTVMKWTRPLLRSLGGRVTYTALLFIGIGGVLAYYSARGALIPQVNNGGWISVVCIAAFAAPIITAFELGAGGLIGVVRRKRALKREAAQPASARATR